MAEQTESKWKFHGVRVAHGNELDVNTAQTPGMNRAAAITNARAGAKKLWAGTVVIHPEKQTRGQVLTTALITSVPRAEGVARLPAAQCGKS